MRCLAAIFTEMGQLATPQQITGSTPGIAPPWRTVEYLLPLVSDDDVQGNFNYIQTWLNHQPQPEGLKLVLDALGTNAFRLSPAQTDQLAQFIFNRLKSQPAETYLVDFIGKTPDRDDLREDWRALVSAFMTRYMRWMETKPTMSSHETDVFGQIHEYQWRISEQAESLLIQKLQAANVPNFDPWLDALVPLVGNRRRNIHEAVKSCFEKNQRVEQAFSAGHRVLWKNEINPEAAAVIGRFFINNRSSIPSYQDTWQILGEKKGAGAVLEVMQDQLPDEAGDLVIYGNALTMLAEGFEQLDNQRKRSFVDKRVLPLISSSDSEARQMGLNLTRELPVVSPSLKKQLKSLQKDGKLSDQQIALVEEILKKPVV